jgi:hypothetical protein
MPTPTVEKIRHLKGVGIFTDVGVGQCPHDFKRLASVAVGLLGLGRGGQNGP